MTPEQLSFYRKEFERCWKWLEAAIDVYGKTHSKDQVWKLIEDGKAQLWPTPNAVLLTSIDEYQSGLKELRGWLSGGDLNEIMQWEPIIAAWAKDNGCQRAVITGRRGWLKAFRGYRELATIMVKDF